MTLSKLAVVAGFVAILLISMFAFQPPRSEASNIIFPLATPTPKPRSSPDSPRSPRPPSRVLPDPVFGDESVRSTTPPRQSTTSASSSKSTSPGTVPAVKVLNVQDGSGTDNANRQRRKPNQLSRTKSSRGTVHPSNKHRRKHTH